MESNTNYTLVGLVVVILIAGLLSAGMWLSVGFDRKTYNNYTVYVGEAVSGLSEDSVVKYNGVKVGVVKSIELNPFDPQQVKLQLKIVEGTPITTSTHATLINQGITGNSYLGLAATSPTPFPLQKTPGEPYPVIPYKPSFLSQLEQNLSELSVEFKRIFDKDNAATLKTILHNIQTVTDVMAKNAHNFHRVLTELPSLIADIKTAAHQFVDMSTHLSTAGKDVSTAMQSGKNTMNKLSQQTLPPITLLLNRLDLIAANLDQVSIQMRQNPAVIIRGTSPPKSGPGE